MKNRNDYTKQEKEMLKKYPKMFEPLDEEEKQIMEDVKNGLYITPKNEEEKKEQYSKIAKSYTKSKETKAITLRANKNVIEKIRKKADNCGINYQTYINMFLYQLAEGKIKIEFVNK